MFGKKYATIRKLANRNIIEHKFRHALNIIVVMCLTIFISAFEIVSKVVANDGRYKYFNYNANNLLLFEFSYHLCRCECLFTNAMDCDISFFYYSTFNCNACVNYFADSDILNLLSTYTED